MMDSTSHIQEHSRPNAEAGDPVLDVNLLRTRCLGNESLVQDILAKLKTTVHDEWSLIADAWEQHNLDEVTAVSHRLKGTASNTGAEALCRVASRVEAAARVKDVDQSKEWIAQLESEVARLADVLRQDPSE